MKKRCFGDNASEQLIEYHDKEWGIPVHDDHKLFEMLTLEGAQAGLSWQTVLKKREEYTKAFHKFDPKKVAKMSDSELNDLIADSGIIKNKLKVYSVRKNAIAFLSIEKEFGSFDKYLWAYVDNKPIINHWKSWPEVPVHTPLSEKISKDLKKRGMTFVGPTIIYTLMQAVGLVNDHLTDCFTRTHK